MLRYSAICDALARTQPRAWRCRFDIVIGANLVSAFVVLILFSQTFRIAETLPKDQRTILSVVLFVIVAAFPIFWIYAVHHVMNPRRICDLANCPTFTSIMGVLATLCLWPVLVILISDFIEKIIVSPTLPSEPKYNFVQFLGATYIEKSIPATIELSAFYSTVVFLAILAKCTFLASLRIAIWSIGSAAVLFGVWAILLFGSIDLAKSIGVDVERNWITAEQRDIEYILIATVLAGSFYAIILQTLKANGRATDVLYLLIYWIIPLASWVASLGARKLIYAYSASSVIRELLLIGLHAVMMIIMIELLSIYLVRLLISPKT